MSHQTVNDLLSRLKRMNRLLLFTVVVPTLLAILYFGLIASDQYISESRFVVRSQKSHAPTPLLGNLLQGSAGFSSLAGTQDDAHSINDYIMSRDALAELDRNLQVRKAFSLRGIDLLNHFPSPYDWWEDSFEALFRFYPRRVSVELDSVSSVSVLMVSAFTAGDAQRINETLLKMSERLVNKLNDRARQDMIAYAAAEVREAELKARSAAVTLAAFRNKRAVIDPEKQTALHYQGISKLQEELIASKTLLTQLTTYTSGNPQIPVLRTRIESLQKEIANETARVAGGSGSLAYKASEYERLALEREFADKQLAVAMTALETARNEAQRQQLYLERIAQPNLPDVAIEPRRFRSTVIVLVLGLIIWGILSLLIASVREHLE